MDTINVNNYHLELWDEGKLDKEKLKNNLEAIDSIIEELADEFRSILGAD